MDGMREERTVELSVMHPRHIRVSNQTAKCSVNLGETSVRPQPSEKPVHRNTADVVDDERLGPSVQQKRFRARIVLAKSPQTDEVAAMHTSGVLHLDRLKDATAVP
jgi:hypothetical protein